MWHNNNIITSKITYIHLYILLFMTVHFVYMCLSLPLSLLCDISLTSEGNEKRLLLYSLSLSYAVFCDIFLPIFNPLYIIKLFCNKCILHERTYGFVCCWVYHIQIERERERVNVFTYVYHVILYTSSHTYHKKDISHWVLMVCMGMTVSC